jgi:RHS repeat-associated protein
VYDDNGNQTQRVVNGQTYNLTYDAESRLVEVKKNSTVIATFAYDGDGKQVKGIVNGVTTYYVGAHYQKQGTVVTKYYYAGMERVAMRQGGVLYYIFGDHLGSTAVVKNTQGGKTELRYTAWGTTRYEYGSTPTDRRYTGQREEANFGLYFYNARWYDPALGRFIQADTIIPRAGNPQAWDRYAYANNNPANSTDPTGHRACADVDSYGNCITKPIEKKRSQPPQPPQPWRYSKDITVGFHIGPTAYTYNPDYNSDNLNDPIVCDPRGAWACIAHLLSWTQRFPVTGPSNIDKNFWVNFNVAYDEYMGITISDMTIINYYKNEAILSRVGIESGENSLYLQSTEFTMPHGFGSDFSLPNPPKPFDGNNPLTIKFEVGYDINVGNGPFTIYPDYRIMLPSLPALKYFIQTGQILQTTFFP